MMEERGIISGFDGSKARKVLIDENDLPRVLGGTSTVAVDEPTDAGADEPDELD